MATKKRTKKAAPGATEAVTKTPRVRKPRAVKDPLSTEASTPRQKRDSAAPFPIKIRMETALKAHLVALSPLIGKKERKVTRVDLRDYLKGEAQKALDRLLSGAAVVSTQAVVSEDDDLLG